MTLIEVLVTILILSVGLLGMAGLQSRLQQSEMESYQRSQALVLLDDMANRIATNRRVASTYDTGGVPLGSGMTCPTGNANQRERDIAEWCNALQGAAEALAGTNAGAMIGGRGCIENLGGGEFRVSVAWQGLTALSAPPVALTCGANQYNGPTGTECSLDRCRRVVSTIIRVADLK